MVQGAAERDEGALTDSAVHEAPDDRTSSEPRRAHEAALREHFDRLAASHTRWERKNRYYHERLASYFRFLIPRGKRVLELGCGDGSILATVAPSNGLGLDISPGMVALARSRYAGCGELTFQVGDERSLTMDEPFDYVILSDVVGDLHDIEATFKTLRGVCSSETRLVISYYNFLWEPIVRLSDRLGLKRPHRTPNWLSPHDLHNLLSLAGYEVVRTDRRTLLPKNVPLLSRFLNGFVAALPLASSLCLNFFVVARKREVPDRRKDCSVSIVIPTRNERGNIEAAVQRLPAFGRSQEILFVDGHSTDGTVDEIQRVMEARPDAKITLLVQEGRGKGDAVRLGFDRAQGEVLMILDADLTVAPEDLPRFYDALTSGVGEFINGCRLVYPMEKRAMRFLNLLGNKFFGLAFTWLLNQPFKDTLCGTKVLFKSDYREIVAQRSYFGDFDPFGDFDLIFGAAKLNLKIVEVPVRYRERLYGTTNIHRFRHGWILLKMCLFAFKKLKTA